MNVPKPNVLIIAAEASSSLYAQRLLEHWRDTGFAVNAFGIGSREMEALGFEILGRSEELAVMGLVEVLKHYTIIRDAFYKVVEAATTRKPQVILLMDYPGFNLRLAEKLQPLGIPIVYYISPQVWAWKKSRIHKIKRLVNRMLVLLPFEKPFYEAHGVDVDFVGHPLLDEISPKLLDSSEQEKKRSRYGIKPEDTWIGIMPGSRNSELVNNLAYQIQAAECLYAKNQNLKFALLVAPSLTKEQVSQQLPNYSFPLVILRDDPMQMVSMVDYVICASGTATLVVGLLNKPMVITYRMSPFTAWVAKKVVKGVRFFGLVNLISDREIVKEFFQQNATPENIASEIERLIKDVEYKGRVKNDLAALADKLGNLGATIRVAKTLEPFFKI